MHCREIGNTFQVLDHLLPVLLVLNSEITLQCLSLKGTRVYVDGSTYTGQMRGGLRDGQGVWLAPAVQYEGQWLPLALSWDLFSRRLLTFKVILVERMDCNASC